MSHGDNCQLKPQPTFAGGSSGADFQDINSCLINGLEVWPPGRHCGATLQLCKVSFVVVDVFVAIRKDASGKWLYF